MSYTAPPSPGATGWDVGLKASLDSLDAEAVSAQGAADNAQADADAAQGDATTALANAATAQSTADGAQSDATTALSNAATAQNAADAAQSSATSASETANDAASVAGTAVQPADLATVATTGVYSDLTGTPSIPNSPDDIGAATAAQGALADSAVQPGDLGSTLSDFAAATGTVTTTTTQQDCTGASVTVTTAYANAVAIIIGTWDFSIGSGTLGGLATGVIVVDGSAQSALARFKIQTAAERDTVSQTARVVLTSAGAHTLKIACYRNDSGALCNANAGNTTIAVIVLDYP